MTKYNCTKTLLHEANENFTKRELRLGLILLKPLYVKQKYEFLGKEAPERFP